MKQCHGEPEKTAEIEIGQIASENDQKLRDNMSFAILPKYSYCPVCRPKMSEIMPTNAQSRSRKRTSGCPARQIIGQVSGFGDGFVLHN